MAFFNSLIDSLKQKEPEFSQIPNGDPSRGKKVFEKHCADCHYIRRIDDTELQAPTLAGLMGRKTGNTNFKASSALRKANFRWNEEHLFNFLLRPQKYIPGTLMVWAGMRSAQERADLIAFIKMN